VRIAGILSVYKYNSISSIKPDSQTTENFEGTDKEIARYAVGSWGQAYFAA
jgi:hypothetical protein